MITKTPIETVTKKRFDRERKLKIEAEKLLEQKTSQLYETQLKLRNKIKIFTDSIQYALKIQNAILPSVQKFNQLFKQHFILYKPKAIVSGDFYWCSKVNNKIIIAVLDCTGHGVPGAFMSMIGNTLLNEIIIQNKIITPFKILNSLNQGIRNSLQKNENKVNDGIDMGLCCIEHQDNGQIKLSYSGAKNKLYIVRENQLFELKSCRRSIGNSIKNQQLSFKSQSMMLHKGDQIYLTTDGFIDQANPERKRLGIEKFKSLILLYSHLNMKEQKDFFTKALEDHQQYTDQRDDITLLGIKL